MINASCITLPSASSRTSCSSGHALKCSCSSHGGIGAATGTDADDGVSRLVFGCRLLPFWPSAAGSSAAAAPWLFLALLCFDGEAKVEEEEAEEGEEEEEVEGGTAAGMAEGEREDVEEGEEPDPNRSYSRPSG